MKVRNPFLLSKKFYPPPGRNRMKNVDNVLESREYFLENRPGNLNFLLEQRYTWMNKFIASDQIGIEVGCGNGLSKEFITSNNYSVTDYTDYYWVDKKVDALSLPYANNSLDYIIGSNMIHHLSRPAVFFNECYRVLKPGGKLIVQEVNASFCMRLILKLMNHEGYDYNVNPYDEKEICNDPADLWSGNNALPNLLFDDKEMFESHFKFSYIKNSYTEFFIFLISGGVTAKVRTINLPVIVLRVVYVIDQVLIAVARDLFALQRQIVLMK